MGKWEVDGTVRRAGGYEDDEKASGYDSPDWEVWLCRPKTETDRVYHMNLQFPRPGVDRARAEKWVRAAIDGLNSVEE